MKWREFYQKVIPDEETDVAFLRQHEVLLPAGEEGPCIKCGSVMNESRRRRRDGTFVPALRCGNRKCQTYRSLRSTNPFLTWREEWRVPFGIDSVSHYGVGLSLVSAGSDESSSKCYGIQSQHRSGLVSALQGNLHISR